MTITATADPNARMAEKHGWITSEDVETLFGSLEFRGGYPAGNTARRLADQLFFNRAIEVYLAQMPAVSWLHVWKGTAAAGQGAPNQLVIWEKLMNAETLLLTGNAETVYGLAAIDLLRDGPVMIEAPAMLLGGINDMWQRNLADIGPTGLDRGKGGTFLLLPPGFVGEAPRDFTVKCPTFKVSLGVRAFLEDGKPDPAVDRLKRTRIYPLSKARNSPMTFTDGSGQRIDTIFPDRFEFFEALAQLIRDEPVEVLLPHERFQLASIGIENGKPFAPDSWRRKLLDEAARVGSAIARGNSFASADPARLVYPDRNWEWAFIGGTASWNSQGYINTDRRAAFAYIAIGMSPAMVNQVVGEGSQYLWTTRDAGGTHLDGSQKYRLRLPAKIPVKKFWSVVVYDAESRSMLRNGQKFPAVSQYTDPQVNSDGSIDIHFGPELPSGEPKNWIPTIRGKGWFPLLRFYGPLEAFFDKSWKPEDIVEVK